MLQVKSQLEKMNYTSIFERVLFKVLYIYICVILYVCVYIYIYVILNQGFIMSEGIFGCHKCILLTSNR